MIAVFAASRSSAVGICALITAYWSGSSSSATGTMLKFAAIGVMSVPQKPDSIPTAAMTTTSPPNWCTMSGSPMPAVITGNAANALPMIAVKSAMPTVYADDRRERRVRAGSTAARGPR